EEEGQGDDHRAGEGLQGTGRRRQGRHPEAVREPPQEGPEEPGDLREDRRDARQGAEGEVQGRRRREVRAEGREPIRPQEGQEGQEGRLTLPLKPDAPAREKKSLARASGFPDAMAGVRGNVAITGPGRAPATLPGL